MADHHHDVRGAGASPLAGLARGAALVIAVIASLICMAALPSAAHAAAPNWQMPTAGGVQLWRDERLRGGWRLQRNVWTGHCRLLDQANVRRAWGRCSSVSRTMTHQAPPNASRKVVLLVHGIARGPSTFGTMPALLRERGYETFAISYPSTRAGIDDHAQQLKQLIQRMQHVDEVSFVTHSMGGLVVRQLLADKSWQARVRPGRVVMIAPPNQGSVVAATLHHSAAYKSVYGPAGQQLTPQKANLLPVPSVPFAIIAGGKSDAWGYNPVLDGDDDGTVKVAETLLPGANAFVVLPGLHANVAKSALAATHVINFLEHGRF